MTSAAKNQIERLQNQNERLEQALITLRVYLWNSESAAETIEEIAFMITSNCREIERIEKKEYC